MLNKNVKSRFLCFVFAFLNFLLRLSSGDSLGFSIFAKSFYEAGTHIFNT
jgi:hypothetical protein